MTVRELNRDQLIDLKQQHMIEEYDRRGETPSWGELADADNMYSDEYIYSVYENYSFSPDDFPSSAGQPGDEYNLELGDCIGDRTSIAAELRQIADLIENGYYSGIANYGTNWSIM